MFRDRFAGLADRYVLIGGAAVEVAMDAAALEFRVTKDLDIVLYVESLDAEFARAFWAFIAEGGFEPLGDPARRGLPRVRAEEGSRSGRSVGVGRRVHRAVEGPCVDRPHRATRTRWRHLQQGHQEAPERHHSAQSVDRANGTGRASRAHIRRPGRLHRTSTAQRRRTGDVWCCGDDSGERAIAVGHRVQARRTESMDGVPSTRLVNVRRSSETRTLLPGTGTYWLQEPDSANMYWRSSSKRTIRPRSSGDRAQVS